MSLSKLALGLLVVVFTALAGCGYTPAYAPTGTAQTLRINVAMDAPRNRNDFDLVGQLEQRLGHAQAPKYRLSYKIDTTRDLVGVTPGQRAVRYNIFGKVRYTLTEITSGAVMTSGSTDTFTGYSLDRVVNTTSPPSTNATISTQTAERDAAARLMVALADQIVTRLIASSGAWSK